MEFQSGERVRSEDKAPISWTIEVLRCTQGRSYILKEMDGTVSRRGVAAFRRLPYHAREGIPLPIDDLHLDDLDDSDKES